MFTVKDIYLHVLTELNKVEAPTLLLDDFIYLLNKAVQQYVNKKYNSFEINQQLTDDLRALRISTQLDITRDSTNINNPSEGNMWYCELPNDYLHILNCVIKFKYNGEDDYPGKNCSRKGEDDADGGIFSSARKMTSNAYPAIIQNAYLKPSYRNPYFFITNRETDEGYENIIEIRCGKSDYIPEIAFIDYIKTPKYLTLTRPQIHGVEDSDLMEFSDYVCYEIINEVTKLALENFSDPRLQTNMPINQSIATPGIQQK